MKISLRYYFNTRGLFQWHGGRRACAHHLFEWRATVVDVLVVVSSGGVLVDVLMLVEMLVVGEVTASTAANASM